LTCRMSDCDRTTVTHARACHHINPYITVASSVSFAERIEQN
jgi:hypothetical protein